MTEEIIAKIEVGDGLTDKELDITVEFFRQMEEGLLLLGPKFHLAWEPVMRRHQQYRGYQQARERNRREAKS